MWEFQMKPGENLYFGHPYSKETYTNAIEIKTSVLKWETDLSKLYSKIPVEFKSEDYELLEKLPDCENEERFVRGTKVLFIGGTETRNLLLDDLDLYHMWERNAEVKVTNPDYLSFSEYTAKILNDPLDDLEKLTSLDPGLAKKYMEYAVQYEKDSQYSNKLILQPYFYTTDQGVLIRTSDFVDFKIELKVSLDLGVIGFIIQIQPCSSHFLRNYKEI